MAKSFYCNGCGKSFSGLSLFDKHRVGHFTDHHPDYGRVCRTPYHLALMEWRLKDGVWHGPAIPEDQQWWRKKT